MKAVEPQRNTGGRFVMTADPAILKRIRGCPFARGGRVLVRFRAHGYSLFARRSGGTVGAATLDRQRRRGRAALPLAPRWLGRARRLRRKRHVARQSAPVPQRQSIFPGLARDLQLSRFRGSMRSRNAVPCKLQLGNITMKIWCVYARSRINKGAGHTVRQVGGLDKKAHRSNQRRNTRRRSLTFGEMNGRPCAGRIIAWSA